MVYYPSHGEMSEWFKELVLKTSDPARDRGFESHSLRQLTPFPGIDTGSIPGKGVKYFCEELVRRCLLSGILEPHDCNELQSHIGCFTSL